MLEKESARGAILHHVRFWFFSLVIAATPLALAAEELLGRAIDAGARGHPELFLAKLAETPIHDVAIITLGYAIFTVVGVAFHAFYFGTGIEVPYEVASFIFAFFKIRDAAIEVRDADVPIWLRKIDVAGGLWILLQIAAFLILSIHLTTIVVRRMWRRSKASSPSE